MQNQSEYAQKIQTYSKSAMEVVMRLMTSEERAKRIHEIILSSKTEEEAVQKMKAKLETK